MTQPSFDLRAAAHQEMLAEGFQPDFPPAVEQQVKSQNQYRDAAEDAFDECGECRRDRPDRGR